MGLFSLANLFGVTLRESANDGSDFTNPDADYRRVFLGEDGLLHAKDSAGTVTSLGGTGLSDPMTTRGDIIVRNASNVTARLAIGSTGKVLQSDGTDISWQTPAAGTFSGAAVYANTTQTVNNSAVLFHAEEYDTDSYHDTSSNKEKLTVPSTGKYLVHASLYDTTGAFSSYFKVNNAAIHGTNCQTTSSFQGLHLSAMLSLTAGDYVTVFGGTGGGNHTFFGDAAVNESTCRFEITRLG